MRPSSSVTPASDTLLRTVATRGRCFFSTNATRSMSKRRRSPTTPAHPSSTPQSQPSTRRGRATPRWCSRRFACTPLLRALRSIPLATDRARDLCTFRKWTTAGPYRQSW
eukprot:Amastigsp_a176709_16.p3 type:complete len:110 gc:universal Amastigsp_a176709_16:676-347(-)